MEVGRYNRRVLVGEVSHALLDFRLPRLDAHGVDPRPLPRFGRVLVLWRERGFGRHMGRRVGKTDLLSLRPGNLCRCKNLPSLWQRIAIAAEFMCRN